MLSPNEDLLCKRCSGKSCSKISFACIFLDEYEVVLFSKKMISKGCYTLTKISLANFVMESESAAKKNARFLAHSTHCTHLHTYTLYTLHTSCEIMEDMQTLRNMNPFNVVSFGITKWSGSSKFHGSTAINKEYSKIFPL